jgi:hypothetical protein
MLKLDGNAVAAIHNGLDVLNPANYALEVSLDGSNGKLTFAKAYLESLPVGQHLLTVSYVNPEAGISPENTTVVINIEPALSPQASPAVTPTPGNNGGGPPSPSPSPQTPAVPTPTSSPTPTPTPTPMPTPTPTPTPAGPDNQGNGPAAAGQPQLNQPGQSGQQGQAIQPDQMQGQTQTGKQTGQTQTSQSQLNQSGQQGQAIQPDQMQSQQGQASIDRTSQNATQNEQAEQANQSGQSADGANNNIENGELNVTEPEDDPDLFAQLDITDGTGTGISNYAFNNEPAPLISSVTASDNFMIFVLFGLGTVLLGCGIAIVLRLRN